MIILSEKNKSAPISGDPKDRKESDGFYQRWSALKQQQDETRETDESGESLATTPATEDKPVLSEKDLPDVETLDENSNFADFLNADIGEELRNRALRKLFHLAVFNSRDGLDDYDDDFTEFEPLGSIVTADMKHQEEVRLAREQAQQQEEAVADAESVDNAIATDGTADTETATEPAAGEIAGENEQISDDDEPTDTEKSTV